MKKYLINSCLAIFGMTAAFCNLEAQSSEICVSGELTGSYYKIAAVDNWNQLIPDSEERKNLSLKSFKIKECGSSVGTGELSIEFVKANETFRFVRIIRDEYSKFDFYNNSNIRNSNKESRVLTYSTSRPDVIIYGDYPKTDAMYDFSNFNSFYLDYTSSKNHSTISISKLNNSNSDIKVCVLSSQGEYCASSK